MRNFFLLLACIAILSPSNTNAGKKLHFVTDPFPPYFYTENETTKGIVYELMLMTFNKMKIPFDLNFTPWKRALMMAENKKSDGIPGAAWSSERAQNLIYANEPLVVTEIVIFHRTDTPFIYNDILSLNGKRIGTIRGYVYGEPFDSHSQCTKELGESLEQNLKKLAAGRIDLVISYKMPGIFKLREHKLTNKITYSDTPVRRTPIYLAFSKKNGHGAIAKNFSKILFEIKKTKECKERILKLNIPEDIPVPCY